ncbi:hypothetical protein HO173_001398 [Letharia columbiana]|uniref:Uncharacterized protein n=1 Tax=Letharia columbiana TaxID=112416 RepID=A0A8H6G5F8_9LECA|nr:uncharacterized protein HO173_001398 [Letharia columbiana]KAF6240725.1 hypothetical protein HO173_001398 [Letharia columbiana]
MSSNTPASVSVRIVRVSKTSPTDDEDLNRLISLCTATSRSNAFICCLLRQPHSDTSYKQYAHFHYLSVLEDNNSRVFIAHGTASHNLGTDLGSVWIMNCKINAPPPAHKLPDFIKEGCVQIVVGNMDKQRRAAMKRDCFGMFIATA